MAQQRTDYPLDYSRGGTETALERGHLAATRRAYERSGRRFATATRGDLRRHAIGGVHRPQRNVLPGRA